MPKEWMELSKLTRGQAIVVERVRLADSGIAVEGEFQLPELAQLEFDDQAFVAAFVKCHGSIKQMEKYFGISYPTVKARLNRISDKLDFVEIELDNHDQSDILDQLDRGEISFDDAMKKLEEGE